jgi:glycosyltransferase involved in cell wall biosynthesis
MKVLHLGNVPVPFDHSQKERVSQHPGRWVLNHAIAQKQAGMDVEVVAQAHKATRDFVCEIEGVKVHFLRTYHPYRHFTFYAIDQLRMASYVKKLRPDIVHAHGTEAAYALAAIRTGLPFCVTAQGLFFQIIPTLGHKPDWNMRFIRMSEHYAWKRTKYAIAKSEYVRDAMAKEYPHLDLTLIPNTYQPELDGELKPKTGKKLAFVGTIDERKGVHLIAEAMKAVAKHHPDVELHIVGNQPGGTGSPYAIEQIASLRRTLGDRLVLHGKLPSTVLFSVLDDCVALLAPSLEEMFGNQLVEGLMRGCHGIVAEGTALAENVRRFGNGIVVVQNAPMLLASEICDTLACLPTAEQAESSRQKIRAYMAPAVVAAVHRGLYMRVLAEKSDA